MSVSRRGAVSISPRMTERCCAGCAFFAVARYTRVDNESNFSSPAVHVSTNRRHLVYAVPAESMNSQRFSLRWQMRHTHRIIRRRGAS